MGTYNIKKGKNIPLKGTALKELVELSLPKTIAIQPPDFKGIKPRLIAKLDTEVKVGSTVLVDKINPDLKIVSPVSGKVVAVNRGHKRALLEIVIETDGKQESEPQEAFSEGKVKELSKEEISQALLKSGLWPVIRQRPFSKIANQNDKPKSIFVRAMSTDPLAADVDFLLEGKEASFQCGLNILNKLTNGEVHLCYSSKSKSTLLSSAKNVQSHTFSGAHPTGNISTHIHSVDPINKGDIVWYVEAVDVVRIGEFFLTGKYPIERIVAVAGEGAEKKAYFKTILGAPLKDLLSGSKLENNRCISGSVLSGRDVGSEGFIGFYDSLVSVIPEGGKREFMGWISPGPSKFTFSKTFVSSFLPQGEVSLDTDTHGSHRAIVFNNVYDSLVTLDILTFFLLRACIANDIEEAEKLGILECDPEDFALCTVACPSKNDIGAIIRQGLEVIEKEG